MLEGIIIMNETKNTNVTLGLTRDDLASLLLLANNLPINQRKVLSGLLQYIEPGTWKSSATREQLRQATGLSLKTIYRFIKDFEDHGLLKQWQGPRGVNQHFYRINLPIPAPVLAFYRKAHTGKIGKTAKMVVEPQDQQQQVQLTATNTLSDTKCRPSGRQSNSSSLTKRSGRQDVSNLGDEIGAVAASTGGSGVANDDHLDPQILEAIEKLEKAQKRNVAVQFLTSVGAIPFQIACDETFRINRTELLRVLKERKANSTEGFCALVEAFSKTPEESWPPRIDLQTSDSIELLMDRTFEGHYDGASWLRKEIKWNSWGGLKPMDDEIRLWFIRFMAENRIRTLDEVFALGLQKDKEIKEERKKQADGSRNASLG
jgi:hypothetical protein